VIQNRRVAPGRPWRAGGCLLAGLIGTTGAAMVLIHPFLPARVRAVEAQQGEATIPAGFAGGQAAK